MSSDPTIPQSGGERRRSQELSLERTRPPCQVPGYEAQRFLGAGAYGEVWVALDRNTGVRVAIKYYAHRGGLDWSLLAREVEKLRFLFADRYVVQLIAVGWDADPPYYVMEYVEHGSLADRLNREGTLPVHDAVALFREVAIGLVHAHGKGVLHCDLKPANVLLDQDSRPRLADFGQSRLSHEQTPALGTLFYMAPEQADLQAMPDARWDVYALGALLYTMLTGQPPHRTDERVAALEQPSGLEDRLARYRVLIESSPPPDAHRKVAGVDRALADIIDRCLAADPRDRFPNVQAVLDSLQVRHIRRARRPLMILGAVGPALLMAVVALFALYGFRTAYDKSDAALTRQALGSNKFAAQFVAETAARELEKRYRLVESAAASQGVTELLSRIAADPELSELLEQLSDPELAGEDEQLDADQLATRQRLQQRLEQHELHQQLQQLFFKHYTDGLNAGTTKPLVASWFVNDARGVQIARVPDPDDSKIGINYAWRTYFHGDENDKDPAWRGDPDPPRLAATHLSSVFSSQVTGKWIVAVSTPVVQDDTFLGIVALSVEIGQFAELQRDDADQTGSDRFAVLVDARTDPPGLILQHELYQRLLEEPDAKLPPDFQKLRVPIQALNAMEAHYVDPLAGHPLGAKYDRRWLAARHPVEIEGDRTGLHIVVQESYNAAIGAALADLERTLLMRSLAAVAVIVIVITAMWGLVLRTLNQSGGLGLGGFGEGTLTARSTPSGPDALATAFIPPSSPTPAGSDVTEIHVETKTER